MQLILPSNAYFTVKYCSNWRCTAFSYFWISHSISAAYAPRPDDALFSASTNSSKFPSHIREPFLARFRAVKPNPAQKRPSLDRDTLSRRDRSPYPRRTPPSPPPSPPSSPQRGRHHQRQRHHQQRHHRRRQRGRRRASQSRWRSAVRGVRGSSHADSHSIKVK